MDPATWKASRPRKSRVMHPVFFPSMPNVFQIWRTYSNHPKMRATKSQLKGRLPKQIQRALPIYILLVFMILVFSNLDAFASSSVKAKGKHTSHHKRAPTTPNPKFPRKIWQTWKVDALDFEERDLLTARTWTVKNPGHRYECLTDNNDLYYVETHFGPDGLDRPDIVDMYRALTAKIIKADILRYLVMYVEGGIYADIDVEALKPVDRWIPDRYNEADIDMVISVEIDQLEFKNHPILGKKSQSFCQWTFLSKPGLPVMLTLVENIMDWLNDLAAKQKVPISELMLDFDEVISGTGPSAFTIAVLEAMSAKEGKEVTWDTFHNMAESKLVGGVLVLTVEAFAAGQGHSDSGNHNARTALVKHHYHASLWPVAHPRYSHPIFGEVEKCNWVPECVKLWDDNKAAFEALSAEEQAVRLALHEADVQRQAMMPPQEPSPMFQNAPQPMFGAPPQQLMLGAPPAANAPLVFPSAADQQLAPISDSEQTELTEDAPPAVEEKTRGKAEQELEEQSQVEEKDKQEPDEEKEPKKVKATQPQAQARVEIDGQS